MNMKNQSNNFYIVAVIALVALAPWMLGSRTATVEPVTAETLRTISVRGDAEIRVVPDEVLLTLGVETIDDNLQSAKKQNDKTVKQVVDTIESFDIPAEHIKMEYLYIDQMRCYSCSDGDFVIRKTIMVTLRDLTKFEDLITEVISAGVTNVHGVEFRTTELRKYKDQARELAIKAAQEKARDLAKGVDQKIGVPTNIYEDYVYSRSGYSSWWGSYWGSNSVAQNVVQEVSGSGDLSYEDGALPGQISVRAQVSVTFELEN
jgi:uncharacterized protein YggE